MEISSNKSLKKFFNDEYIKIKNSSDYISGIPYTDDIGSIPLAGISYNDQLSLKQSALEKIYGMDVDLAPSPEILNYRLRMDYVCSHNPFHEPQNRFGQRKMKRFNWVVDMNESVLFNKKWFKKARELFELAISEGIEIYDLVKNTGDFRYIVLKGDKEIMISIVSKSGDFKKYKSLMQKAIDLGFSSVLLVHQPSLTDTSEGEVVEFLGNENIEVSLGEKGFIIGHNTFFQNNLSGFELILDDVRKELKSNSTEKLIDLYSGVGTLGIIFSEYFKEIFGFDINPENVKMTKQICELNNIDNYMNQVKDLNTNYEIDLDIKKETLIVDPPRIGLEERGIKHVLKFEPKKIIYISCNPITQKKDIDKLQKNGYKLKSLKSYDLFPLTYHMESLAILEAGGQ